MKKLCSYQTLTADNVQNQRVFLRADLNVPLQGQVIEDDFRLQEVRPTLDLLIKQQATVFLVTHLGRPHKENKPVLSTKILSQWLCEKGYPALFASTISEAQELGKQHPGSIIVLENIRTFPGEMTSDLSFAKELAALADYYVNDAFGTLHRNETSISLTPLFFEPEKRFIGLLVADELAALSPLVDNPPHPFVVVIGGGKVADKIPLIEGFIGKADTILLCPAIAFTFMKAQGISVGESLVDAALIDYCKKLLSHVATTSTKLVLPFDLQVAQDSFDGPLSNKEASSLEKNDKGVALGPLSTATYATEITQAKSVFLNAAMGFFHRPETLVSAKALIKALGLSNAYGVIGGGDSVALAKTCPLGKGIRHLSTGGGSTLAYLSGRPLPGLEALCVTKQDKS